MSSTQGVIGRASEESVSTSNVDGKGYRRKTRDKIAEHNPNPQSLDLDAEIPWMVQESSEWPETKMFAENERNYANHHHRGKDRTRVPERLEIESYASIDNHISQTTHNSSKQHLRSPATPKGSLEVQYGTSAPARKSKSTQTMERRRPLKRINEVSYRPSNPAFTEGKIYSPKKVVSAWEPPESDIMSSSGTSAENPDIKSHEPRQRADDWPHVAQQEAWFGSHNQSPHGTQRLPLTVENLAAISNNAAAFAEESHASRVKNFTANMPEDERPLLTLMREAQINYPQMQRDPCPRGDLKQVFPQGFNLTTEQEDVPVHGSYLQSKEKKGRSSQLPLNMSENIAPSAPKGAGRRPFKDIYESSDESDTVRSDEIAPRDPERAPRTGDASYMNNKYVCHYKGCLHNNINRGFKTVRDLKAHKSFDHDVCTKCDLDFENFGALLKHKQLDPNHVACWSCGMDFHTAAARDNHMQSQHPATTSIDCPGCGMTFSSSPAFVGHVERNMCKGISDEQLNKARMIFTRMKGLSGFRHSSKPEVLKAAPGTEPLASLNPDNSQDFPSLPSAKAAHKDATKVETAKPSQMPEPPHIRAIKNAILADPPHVRALSGASGKIDPPHIRVLKNVGQPDSPLIRATLGSYDRPTAPSYSQAAGGGGSSKVEPPHIRAMKASGQVDPPHIQAIKQQHEAKHTNASEKKEPKQQSKQSSSQVAKGNSQPASLIKLLESLSTTDKKFDDDSKEQRLLDIYFRMLNNNNPPELPKSADGVIIWAGVPGHPEYNPEGFRNMFDNYICPHAFCNRPFPSDKALDTHLRSPKHQNKELRCPECMQAFHTAHAIVSHMMSPSQRCNIKHSAIFRDAMEVASGSFLTASHNVFGQVVVETQEPDWSK